MQPYGTCSDLTEWQVPSEVDLPFPPHPSDDKPQMPTLSWLDAAGCKARSACRLAFCMVSEHREIKFESTIPCVSLCLRLI